MQFNAFLLNKDLRSHRGSQFLTRQQQLCTNLLWNKLRLHVGDHLESTGRQLCYSSQQSIRHFGVREAFLNAPFSLFFLLCFCPTCKFAAWEFPLFSHCIYPTWKDGVASQEMAYTGCIKKRHRLRNNYVFFSKQQGI